MKRGVPLLLLLIGLTLRVYRIADHNLWWDEGFSVVMARLPLRDMAVRTAADVHPPVHYAFLHYWIRLVGESEYAIRYATALFGVLDLALLFWLGRRYLGWTTAVVAVGFLAVNRLHVEWSQEIRMYTLAVALVLGSTACFLRVTADGDARPRWFVAHFGLSLVGLHTLYFFGLAPLVQSLIVVVGIMRGRLSGRVTLVWLVVQAAAVAAFSPWLALYLGQPHATPVAVFSIDLPLWLRAVFTALPIGVSAYLDAWTGPMVVGTALLLVPLLLERARGGVGWLFAWAYAGILIAPFAIYALSYPNPVLYSPNLSVRYMLLFLPFYTLLVARGLVLLGRRSRALAGLLGAAGIAVGTWTTADLYASRYLRDEYRTIASFMTSYAEPGDAAVLYSDWEWPVYQYYAPRGVPSFGVSSLRQLTPEEGAQLGSQWLTAHAGIWLVTLNDGYDADPSGYLRKWLEEHARTIADFRVDNRRLTLFSRDPDRSLARAVAAAGRPVAFPERPPRLVSIEQPVREVAAGESLRVATFWHGPGPPDAATTMELVGSDGQTYRRVRDLPRADWSASAWPSAGGVARVDHVLPTADRLAPGPYTVWLSTSAGGQTIARSRVGRLVVRRPSRPPRPALAPPSPPLPQRHDRFDGLIDLVGADPAQPALRPGQPMQLRLLWQAVTAMERPYTAFVQLVGDELNPATGNRVWAQLDAPPDRQHPTEEWLPGDLALDERVLDVPAGAPAGSYELIVGLYDPADGHRLVLPDGADHAVLARYP